MPREKEGFREVLDRLDARFPDTEIIRRSELAEFLGLSKSTLIRRFKKEYNHRLNGYSKTGFNKGIRKTLRNILINLK